MKPRGRPKKPTKLKILEGNPGKRPLNDSEPVFEAGVGDPPDWLSDKAATVWKDLAKIMKVSGVLTAGDRHSFAVMCFAYALAVEAAEDVKANGLNVTSSKGSAYVNPAVYVFKQNAMLFDKFASSFGLNPSARAGLKIAGHETKSDLQKIIES